jgi:hypothetical protein
MGRKGRLLLFIASGTRIVGTDIVQLSPTGGFDSVESDILVCWTSSSYVKTDHPVPRNASHGSSLLYWLARNLEQ